MAESKLQRAITPSTFGSVTTCVSSSFHPMPPSPRIGQFSYLMNGPHYNIEKMALISVTNEF